MALWVKLLKHKCSVYKEQVSHTMCKFTHGGRHTHISRLNLLYSALCLFTVTIFCTITGSISNVCICSDTSRYHHHVLSCPWVRFTHFHLFCCCDKVNSSYKAVEESDFFFCLFLILLSISLKWLVLSSKSYSYFTTTLAQFLQKFIPGLCVTFTFIKPGKKSKIN